MYGYPKKEIVEGLRARYPKGARVELIEMDDPHRDMPAGLRGTVVAVDDIGTVHIAWDNGSSLNVAYGVDKVRILREE